MSNGSEKQSEKASPCKNGHIISVTGSVIGANEVINGLS